MKGSNLFYSIFTSRCPKCRRGDLFKVRNPYHPTRFFQMPENCESCGLKFEMEPGFWYGAMYFSYLLGFVLSLPIVISLMISQKLGFLAGIIIVSAFLVLMTPLLFRYSRTLWIYVFVSYDSKASDLVQ